MSDIRWSWPFLRRPAGIPLRFLFHCLTDRSPTRLPPT